MTRPSCPRRLAACEESIDAVILEGGIMGITFVASFKGSQKLTSRINLETEYS